MEPTDESPDASILNLKNVTISGTKRPGDEMTLPEAKRRAPDPDDVVDDEEIDITTISDDETLEERRKRNKMNAAPVNEEDILHISDDNDSALDLSMKPKPLVPGEIVDLSDDAESGVQPVEAVADPPIQPADPPTDQPPSDPAPSRKRKETPSEPSCQTVKKAAKNDPERAVESVEAPAEDPIEPALEPIEQPATARKRKASEDLRPVLESLQASPSPVPIDDPVGDSIPETPATSRKRKAAGDILDLEEDVEDPVQELQSQEEDDEVDEELRLLASRYAELSAAVDGLYKPAGFKPDSNKTSDINDIQRRKWEKMHPEEHKIKKQRDLLLYALGISKEDVQTTSKKAIKAALVKFTGAEFVHDTKWWNNAIRFSLYTEGTNYGDRYLEHVAMQPEASLPDRENLLDAFVSVMTAKMPKDAVGSDANKLLHHYDLFLAIYLKYREAILNGAIKFPTWKQFKAAVRHRHIGTDIQKESNDDGSAVVKTSREPVDAYLSSYGDIPILKSLFEAIRVFQKSISEDSRTRVNKLLRINARELTRVAALSYALICFRLLHISRYLFTQEELCARSNSEYPAKLIRDAVLAKTVIKELLALRARDFELDTHESDEIFTMMHCMKPVLARAHKNLGDGEDGERNIDKIDLPFHKNNTEIWRSESIRLLNNRMDNNYSKEEPSVFTAKFSAIIDWIEKETVPSDRDRGNEEPATVEE